MNEEERKLILHIGLPKTGSTSIQSFLQLNDQCLLKQKILYPNLGIESSLPIFPYTEHTSFVACAASSTNSEFSPAFLSLFLKNSFDIHSNQQASAFERKFRKRFEASLSQFRSGTVVLSSEQFSTSVRKPAQLSYLKRIVDEYFCEYKIVVYLRAQEHWINSRVSQSAKLGGTATFEELVNASQNNYYEFLKPWWECFGNSNLNIRILDREFLRNGDLIADFLHVIGGNSTCKYTIPSPNNIGLSNEAVQFLQVFNKQVPYFTDSKTVNENRGSIKEMMETYSVDKDKLTLTQEQVLDIRNKYESSNEKLRNQFFPDRPELFPVNLRNVGVNEDISTHGAIEIAAFLWEKQQQLVRDLTEENNQLRKELNPQRDPA